MLTNFYSSHRRLNDVEWSHRLHRSLLNQLLTWIAPKPQVKKNPSCLEPWVAAWRAPGAKLNVRNGVCNLPTSAS